MRTLIMLLMMTATAAAGPAVMPQLVCKETLAVVTVVAVDHGVATLRTRGAFGRMAGCDDDARFHPEGCIVQPARITASRELPVGREYLARLEPSGGATCSTTATATELVPRWAWDLLVGVFSSRP